MKDLDTRLLPGVYDGLPNEVYHGDCCAGPSISSTGIRICAKDPFLYWQTSPLNPDVERKKLEEEAKRIEAGMPPPPASKFTRFATGSAAHLMLLEPELVSQGIAVVPEEMLASNGALSTNAAKAFVKEQAEAGRVVLKPEEWDRICDMADALGSNPRVMKLLEGGTVEQSHIWQDPETGVYLKSRPDVMPKAGGEWIVDYKTTDRDDIEAWERAATCDHRLDMQAALQMAGAYEACGLEARGVVYIVQHVKTARIAIRYFDRDGHADIINVARLDLRKGINAFAHCWEYGDWLGPWEFEGGITAPDFRARQIERQLEDASTGFVGRYGI
jgi:hypothetical protein